MKGKRPKYKTEVKDMKEEAGCKANVVESSSYIADKGERAEGVNYIKDNGRAAEKKQRVDRCSCLHPECNTLLCETSNT